MPPARRTARARAATRPGAVSEGSTGLPELRRVDARVEAPVLALPTRAADTGTTLVAGELDLDVEGLLAREQAKGEPGEVVSLPAAGHDPLERLLLFGVGAARPRDLRRAGAAVARRGKAGPVLVVDLEGLDLGAGAVQALAEGLLLGSYAFTLKTGAEPRGLREVLVVAPAEAEPELERARVVARATAVARDLVNTPSREKSPQWLAATAVALLHDLQVTVRDEGQLAQEGFGGVLGVGQGSARPPRFVEATYDGAPGQRARHVVLVGKGITFDTGGLSLKPNDGMLAMKTDMAGAAAVIGALRAVADLRLPLRVTGLVAAAENMPSGSAQRPGDVLVQYGGRTVEVLNTDAEGRLVLADALAYAHAHLDPDAVVDLATLTGAMPVALGRRTAGLFSTDDALADQLTAASEASGERLWRLPLVEDYRPALDSPVADLRNIGNPKLKLQGGSITAALFLREFTGGRPWAHLDIAGSGRIETDEDELVKGGTGYGVRLLVHWLAQLAALPVPARRGGRRRAAEAPAEAPAEDARSARRTARKAPGRTARRAPGTTAGRTARAAAGEASAEAPGEVPADEAPGPTGARVPRRRTSPSSPAGTRRTSARRPRPGPDAG